MTDLKFPTIEQFKTYKKANADLYKKYVTAKAHADALREKMNKLYSEIFSQMKAEGKIFIDKHENVEISDHNYIWMSDQEDLCKEYYDRTDKARKDSGYDLPYGYCPALIAKSELTAVEREIVEKQSEFIGVDFKEAAVVSNWQAIVDNFLTMYKG